jgi:polyisoprenoid-binding protein YceI
MLHRAICAIVVNRFGETYMPAVTFRSLLPATAALALGIGLVSQPAAAADSFAFDTMHTEILFSYSHLGNSRAFGNFRTFDGEVILDRDDPANSSINLTIAADSIDSGVEAFDTHLKSADFFEVDTYPEITFVSTQVEVTGDTTARVTGDLTIKEHTRPVVLDVTLNYLGEHQLGQFVPDYADMEVAGFSATATLLRSDFGVDMLVPLVGDEVELIIETELLRPVTETN